MYRLSQLRYSISGGVGIVLRVYNLEDKLSQPRLPISGGDGITLRDRDDVALYRMLPLPRPATVLRVYNLVDELSQLRLPISGGNGITPCGREDVALCIIPGMLPLSRPAPVLHVYNSADKFSDSGLSITGADGITPCGREDVALSGGDCFALELSSKYFLMLDTIPGFTLAVMAAPFDLLELVLKDFLADLRFGEADIS